MGETISNINSKIIELSKAIILVSDIIKVNYNKEDEERSNLLIESEKEAEQLMRKELRNITEYSIQYEDLDDNIPSRNTPECWRVEGVFNRNCFMDKKGKFYFRIVLVAPEMQYDEIIDKHILVMDYYPIQDEIYYTLSGVGRFKIEKASKPMKILQKLK